MPRHRTRLGRKSIMNYPEASLEVSPIRSFRVLSKQVEGMLTINGIKDLRENDCPLPPYRVLNVKKGFLRRNIPAERFHR